MEELTLGANDVIIEHVARDDKLQLHRPTLNREDVKNNAAL
jgi:hypothetical protein